MTARINGTDCIHLFGLRGGVCDDCAAREKAIAEGKCENCRTRVATENWVGMNDSLSVARNPHIIEHWCRQCVLEFQIAYAEKIAANLPDLRKQLNELTSTTEG